MKSDEFKTILTEIIYELEASGFKDRSSKVKKYEKIVLSVVLTLTNPNLKGQKTVLENLKYLEERCTAVKMNKVTANFIRA